MAMALMREGAQFSLAYQHVTLTGDTMVDKRVSFDFEVEFSNGGGLQGQGFRLEIDDHEIKDGDMADDALAAYIVRDLRPPRVGKVIILNKRVFEEQHKRGSRTETPAAASTDTGSNFVDLSHPVHPVLLGAGVPIVEHLTNLAALPVDGSRFFAVPPKISAMGTFPIRAHAVLDRR